MVDREESDMTDAPDLAAARDRLRRHRFSAAIRDRLDAHKLLDQETIEVLLRGADRWESTLDDDERLAGVMFPVRDGAPPMLVPLDEALEVIASSKPFLVRRAPPTVPPPPAFDASSLSPEKKIELGLRGTTPTPRHPTARPHDTLSSEQKIELGLKLAAANAE